MTQLLLNAHEIVCDGPHRLWRVDLRGEHVERRDLVSRYGVPIWVARNEAWSVDPIEAPDVSEVSVSCEAAGDIHGFLLREALIRHGRSVGYEVWIGFGNELSCADIEHPLRDEGPVQVEPVLRMRVAREGLDNELTLLVIRRSARWRFVENLGADWLRAVAVGETAVRLRGEGPMRAMVESLAGDELVLAPRRRDRQRVRAEDYTLVAYPTLVYRALRGRPEDADDVLRRVYEATGTIDAYRRRNRMAVRERTEAAEVMLEEFGREVPLPSGGQIRIEERRVEILAAGDEPMEFR
jgi:hypothetical protein